MLTKGRSVVRCVVGSYTIWSNYRLTKNKQVKRFHDARNDNFLYNGWFAY